MATVLERPRGAEAVSLSPEDTLYEVVKGQRVELPPMGAQEIGIAGLLIRYLCLFFGEDPPGLVVPEMLFRLAVGGPERRPDVAYVSFERWPQRVIPSGNAWEAVPNLAVEVVSPTNLAIDIEEKIDDYFSHGVNQVWVIYPPQRRIHVYENPKSIRVLDGNDILDGGTLLPGFQLPLSNLFAVLPPPG